MNSFRDKIIIRQLRAECILGVTAEERSSAQTVFIDLKLYTDISKPAETDQIIDAIDYDQVCKVVTKFVEESSFHLLEALAEGIVQCLFQKFSVYEIKLKVFKPNIIKNAERVGVEIHRKNLHS